MEELATTSTSPSRSTDDDGHPVHQLLAHLEAAFGSLDWELRTEIERIFTPVVEDWVREPALRAWRDVEGIARDAIDGARIVADGRVSLLRYDEIVLRVWGRIAFLAGQGLEALRAVCADRFAGVTTAYETWVQQFLPPASVLIQQCFVRGAPSLGQTAEVKAQLGLLAAIAPALEHQMNALVQRLVDPRSSMNSRNAALLQYTARLTAEITADERAPDDLDEVAQQRDSFTAWSMVLVDAADTNPGACGAELAVQWDQFVELRDHWLRDAVNLALLLAEPDSLRETQARELRMELRDEASNNVERDATTRRRLSGSSGETTTHPAPVASRSAVRPATVPSPAPARRFRTDLSPLTRLVDTLGNITLGLGEQWPQMRDCAGQLKPVKAKYDRLIDALAAGDVTVPRCDLAQTSLDLASEIQALVVFWLTNATELVDDTAPGFRGQVVKNLALSLTETAHNVVGLLAKLVGLLAPESQQATQSREFGR